MKKIALFSGFAVATGSAMAAVPTAVTTAIETMTTDSQAVATLVLVAIIAVAAIKFIRRGL